MTRENYRLRKMAKLVRGYNRILDLGWAEIPNSYLSNRSVQGLDLTERKPPENYSEVHVGDVMALPNPLEACSIDAILAGEIIEHLENPSAFLRGCFSTLDVGGILVISTPNPLSPIELFLNLFLSRKLFYARDHVMLIPQRWLIRLMENAGFSEVRLLSGGFPIPFLGLIPVPRQFTYQTIAIGYRK